ncbi:MAG: hybrid sensor histidine kinase/response regulator [Candidatus Omnitrophica bacterium]|nr:hybrid sensor histidine kinase/response regulator [Candidatus Omnitrophota bacterium]
MTSPSEGSREIRILLVEDDADDACLVQKYLEQSQTDDQRYVLVRVDRLQTGLDSLKTGRFHLVLLDLSLPDSQGLETFIKVRETAPNVAVVICSGLQDRQVSIEAIAKGAQDYVIKGQFDRMMFERVVRYALERRRVQEIQEEFVGKVIHDLGYPLVVSLEAISLILDGFYGDVNKGQRELLTMAQKAMHRLNRMIHGLLDISKIELGKIELVRKKINMADLAREVCANFQPLAAKKGLELKATFPEAPVTACVDEDRMTQVWTNLVSNAVKYTERGWIEVSIHDRGSDVECGVADSGCGVSAEDLKKLFTEFGRVGESSSRRKIEGTGLGLAITKGIVMAHQGKIWAESKLNEGTKITFVLPKE